ncbi:hypothetical protein [Arachidicoccus sp.]|uniref:hypothetical protein n=1 Tax=Arachidicoccus sp. TaxID=1872624 RepID=UPI003D19631B
MDTQLPDFIIAQLYKDNLVVMLPDKTLAPASKPLLKDKEINTSKNTFSNQGKKWWFGNNAKNITIVVEDATNVFIEDNTLAFLSTILSACKFSLEDVAIVNIAKTATDFEEIKNILGSKYVLFLGTTPQQVSLAIQPNLYQDILYQGCHLVFSSQLETMMKQGAEAKAEKGKLWICLKKCFNI